MKPTTYGVALYLGTDAPTIVLPPAAEWHKLRREHHGIWYVYTREGRIRRRYVVLLDGTLQETTPMHVRRCKGCSVLLYALTTLQATLETCAHEWSQSGDDNAAAFWASNNAAIARRALDLHRTMSK